jgi:hypothetical protein
MAKPYIKLINHQVGAFFERVQTMDHEEILDAMCEFRSQFRQLYDYIEHTCDDVLTKRYIDQFTKDSSNFSDSSLINVIDRHNGVGAFSLIAIEELEARKQIDQLKENTLNYFHKKTSRFTMPGSRAPWINDLAKEYQSIADTWIKNKTLPNVGADERDPIKKYMLRECLLLKICQSPQDMALIIRAVKEFGEAFCRDSLSRSLSIELNRMSVAINRNISEYHKNAHYIHTLRCMCPTNVQLKQFPSIANNNRCFKAMYLSSRERDYEYLSPTVKRVNMGEALNEGDIRYLRLKFENIAEHLSRCAIRAFISRDFMDALDERVLDVPLVAQIYNIVFTNK